MGGYGRVGRGFAGTGLGSLPALCTRSGALVCLGSWGQRAPARGGPQRHLPPAPPPFPTPFRTVRVARAPHEPNAYVGGRGLGETAPGTWPHAGGVRYQWRCKPVRWGWAVRHGACLRDTARVGGREKGWRKMDWAAVAMLVASVQKQGRVVDGVRGMFCKQLASPDAKAVLTALTVRPRAGRMSPALRAHCLDRPCNSVCTRSGRGLEARWCVSRSSIPWRSIAGRRCGHSWPAMRGRRH